MKTSYYFSLNFYFWIFIFSENTKIRYLDKKTLW